MKVIPDDATLESAYRRALSIQQYREAIDEATEEIQQHVATGRSPEGPSSQTQQTAGGESIATVG